MTLGSPTERPLTLGIFGSLVLLLLVTTMTAIVVSKLTNYVNPGFLHWEITGVGYDMPFEFLCSDDPRAGLKGSTENVAEQRFMSYFYSYPTKWLYSLINPFTTHRIVTGILFVLFALACWACTRFPGAGLGASALVLVAVVFEPMNVSNVFQAKLVVVSLLWSSMTLAFVIWMERPRLASGTPPSTRRLAIGAALIPFLIVTAYEAYVGSRVLALAMWGACLVYFSVVNWRVSWIYVIATGVALYALHLAHPDMPFTMKILTARTEGPLALDGTIRKNVWALLWDRLAECIGYLNPPRMPPEFDSENIGSHLVSLYAFGAVMLAVVIACCVSPAARVQFRRHLWLLTFVFGMVFVSFLIPLFSNTGVRAHRQFGIYVYLPFLIYILVVVLRRSVGRWATAVDLSTLSLAGLLLWMLAPATVTWQALEDRAAYQTDLDMFYRLMDLAHTTPPNPPTAIVQVCDSSETPRSNTHWNSLLYASRLACRVGARRLAMGCDAIPDIRPYLRVDRTSDGFSIRARRIE